MNMSLNTVYQSEQTLSFKQVCDVLSMQSITQIVKEITNEYERLLNVQKDIINDYKKVLNEYK